MIYKLSISFILFLFLFFFGIIKAVEYKCAADLKIKTCYLEGEENGQQVIYLGTCPKGQTCEKINNIGKCMVSPIKAIIGSSCSENIECLTGLCQNNICTASKGIGATCTSIEDCPINANCIGTSTKTCTQFVEPDGTCTVDEECIVGYACGDTKNVKKCLKKQLEQFVIMVDYAKQIEHFKKLLEIENAFNWKKKTMIVFKETNQRIQVILRIIVTQNI